MTCPEGFRAVWWHLRAWPGYFRVFPVVSATFIVSFIGFVSCFWVFLHLVWICDVIGGF